MDSDAQAARRAALGLMDAADLLEQADEAQKAQGRARVLEVVSQLETVFWPDLAHEEGRPDDPHR
ncbi:hypothetical protein ACFSR9_15220 [Deinococcus taklimakanensis]|uniref:Uncharacterized protein n=1 Tax=Deinococcus taklimakanensis TaxID=536443 RepID=A0ABW5P794_9DEIO